MRNRLGQCRRSPTGHRPHTRGRNLLLVGRLLRSADGILWGRAPVRTGFGHLLPRHRAPVRQRLSLTITPGGTAVIGGHVRLRDRRLRPDAVSRSGHRGRPSRDAGTTHTHNRRAGQLRAVRRHAFGKVNYDGGWCATRSGWLVDLVTTGPEPSCVNCDPRPGPNSQSAPIRAVHVGYATGGTGTLIVVGRRRQQPRRRLGGATSAATTPAARASDPGPDLVLHRPVGERMRPCGRST